MLSQPSDQNAVPLAEKLGARMARGLGVWFFIDYDGTLAEFARTPEEISLNQEVISLLGELVKIHQARVTIISGRRLADIRALIPVPGVEMAGTYGIEMLRQDGVVVHLVDYQTNRVVLDKIKPVWQALIAPQKGFFLEDKGWSLALHARFAAEPEAGEILARAREAAKAAAPQSTFRLLGGDKFLEIAPGIAGKGQTLVLLLHEYPWPNTVCVFIGDDDKDEEGFEVMRKHGGLTIVVAKNPRPSLAEYRLESPGAVRHWLRAVLNRYYAG